MSATFEERDDRHVWTLHDHRVTQLVVELGGVRLVTWTLHSSLDVRLRSNIATLGGALWRATGGAPCNANTPP